MSVAEDLGLGVYHLDTGYIEPGVASFYAVRSQDEIAIVETGTAHSLPILQEFLLQEGISAQQVRYVIPTHVHLDHAGGAGAMMLAFPNAELVIHPSGARHMINPQKLVAATRAVYGDETFERLYGDLPPVDEQRVISAAHDTRIDFNGRELIIIDTPGHAYHHFCVVDTESKGVFSGDTFGLSYPSLTHEGERFVIPTTTPTQFNPQALHASIDLIMSFSPERIYLTHYNMLSSPARHVDQYRSLVDQFVTLTERVAPRDDEGLIELQNAMGELLANEFALDETTIEGKLAMDIKLNSQGLAYWFQKREQ